MRQHAQADLKQLWGEGLQSGPGQFSSMAEIKQEACRAEPIGSLPICRRTARADEDLIEIWLHIAADHPAAADRILGCFSTAEHRLARHPALGPARPDIASTMRVFIVGLYLLLYRRIEGRVEIILVTHGTRDVGNSPLT